VEQAGVAKSNFHGLPSPTAGMTLATFYPFTQTAFFQEHLAALRWSMFTPGLVLGVSVLMVSHVLYPVVPRFSTKRMSGIIAIALAAVSIVAAVTVPALFFFPAAIIYICWGLARSAIAGFQDRLPDRDPLIDEDEDGDEDEERELEYEEFDPSPKHRRGPNLPKENS
jgi:CDP-diacylglycerol---serine O-phosphatidyltransferase